MRDEYDEGHNFNIEAVFLGIFALGLVAVVLFAALTTDLAGVVGRGATGPVANANDATGTDLSSVARPVSGSATTTPRFRKRGNKVKAGGSAVCQCYEAGFRLAGKTNNVQSTAYRTGFSQCRAVASVKGGEYWTAGWNARRAGNPYLASCNDYRRRSARR